MTPKKSLLDESAALIDEVESGLEKALQSRREEIERELQERIRLEKEESERKLNEIEEEIGRERETLKEYRMAIVEYETARVGLQAEIREHMDRSLGYQKEIEALTSQTIDELRRVTDLSSRLAELRDRTELKVAEIRNRLREKFGVSSEPFEARGAGELEVDLEGELSKLKRIKEILETETTAARALIEVAVPGEIQPVGGDSGSAAPPESTPEAEGSFVPPAGSSPEAPTEAPSASDEDSAGGAAPVMRIPEINQFIEEFVKRESEHLGETAFDEPVRTEDRERKPPVADLDFQAVFETLERYRKSEPTDYNGEISYFQNGDQLILDGETIIRAMNHSLDDGRKIYVKLDSTESPKDQFFMKQDLINHQEILRKIILRGVKLCERESCRLPRYTEEILNVQILKNILDKLNLDNWSNLEDFHSFETMAEGIKDTFYKRITPPAHYLKSIVLELEA